MHRRSTLFALLLCLVLVPCRGNAADLAEEQEALVRSLAQSVAAAEQNAPRVRVALFDVDAKQGPAGKSWEQQLKETLEAESTIACQIVGAAEVQQGILKGFDLVLFPGGRASLQFKLLDDSGREAVKEFVRGGGGYVGICAGAFLASAEYDWGWGHSGIGLVNATALERKMDDRDDKTIPDKRGNDVHVKIDLTDAGRRLLGGPPGEFQVLYTSGPVFTPARLDLPAYVSLGTFRSQGSAFQSLGEDMVGTPAIIAGRFGAGRVILFSPHIEFTKGFESLVRRGVLAARRFNSEN